MDPQPSESSGSRAHPADPSAGSSQPNVDEYGNEIEDPLAHMSEIDKWGLKGFSYLMRNYPDYAALVNGIDLSTLGIDMNNPEYVGSRDQFPLHLNALLTLPQAHLRPNLLFVRQ